MKNGSTAANAEIKEINEETPGWERLTADEIRRQAQFLGHYFGGGLGDRLYRERMEALRLARDGEGGK